MKYKYENNRVTVADGDIPGGFDIAQTLECGQCFRFTRGGEKDYTVIAFSKMLRVTQKDGATEFSPCTADEFETVWARYFDLERDYGAIKSALLGDPVMERAIDFAGGIRLLNQDPWECLLSFIISQNMNIPRIKKLIQTLAERYGGRFDGFCSFPSVEQILPAGIEGLTECRTGFRAKYLNDAITKIATGALVLSDMAAMPTPELKAALKSIYGVGDKVADCVSLFSFGRHEVFPTDVWIKRAMQQLYFGGRETRPGEAYAFAQEKFGKYAGVAQQYLFYFMREGQG